MTIQGSIVSNNNNKIYSLYIFTIKHFNNLAQTIRFNNLDFKFKLHPMHPSFWYHLQIHSIEHRNLRCRARLWIQSYPQSSYQWFWRKLLSSSLHWLLSYLALMNALFEVCRHVVISHLLLLCLCCHLFDLGLISYGVHLCGSSKTISWCLLMTLTFLSQTGI